MNNFRNKVEISICPRSSVNAFIEAGWKEDAKNDEMVALTSDELDILQNEYGDLVSQYAWESGKTSNHN